MRQFSCHFQVVCFYILFSAMSQNENISNQPINFRFLFHVIPDPVIIIDKNGNIVEMNLSATDEFAGTGKESKIEDIFADKRKVRTILLELLQFHKVIVDTALIKTKNQEICPFEFKATILSDTNELYLFIFNNLNIRNNVLKFEIEHAFAAEINSLKPYLNKTGKELVEQKITNNSLSLILEDGVKLQQPQQFTDDEIIEKLSKHLPDFSKKELQIAFFLSIDASISQISDITGKSVNALRVMTHRMSAKLNTKNTQELTKTINKIIASEK